MYVGCPNLFGWYCCPLLRMLPNMLLLTHLFDEHMHLHAATNAHAFAQPTTIRHAGVSDTHNIQFAPITTPHVMESLKTLSKSCTVILCFNPLCVSCHNSFTTEKAFTMHRQRSPLCLAIVHCDRTMTPQS
jgi:hypothetical protein